MRRLSNREFVKELRQDPKFRVEYDALELEFELLEKMLRARTAAGLSQNQVAKKMRTTTSVVGRLETAGGKKHHSPSIRSLERYAKALGCRLEIDFIPKSKSA